MIRDAIAEFCFSFRNPLRANSTMCECSSVCNVEPILENGDILAKRMSDKLVGRPQILHIPDQAFEAAGVAVGPTQTFALFVERLPAKEVSESSISGCRLACLH